MAVSPSLARVAETEEYARVVHAIDLASSSDVIRAASRSDGASITTP
jgi:hypothetical protein